MSTSGSETDRDRIRRAGYGLGATAAAATLFVFAPSNDAVRFVAVSVPAVVVLLVLAALGLLGARLDRPLWFAVAGGVGLATAVLQLAQFGRSVNWLNGNGSTAAFLAALGIGFCALWYAARSAATSARDASTPQS